MTNSIWKKVNFDVTMDNTISVSRRLLQECWVKQTFTGKKKIAAVHFNAIPCERYTADQVQGKKKSYVAIFVFVLTALCKLGLKTSGILYECC